METKAEKYARIGKPRLGETVADFWENLYEKYRYWYNLGYYIELNTLGDGIYSIYPTYAKLGSIEAKLSSAEIVKLSGTKKLPTYTIATRHEKNLLDKAVKNDTIEVTAKKSGKSELHGDSYPDYHLHSAAGLGLKE